MEKGDGEFFVIIPGPPSESYPKQKKVACGSRSREREISYTPHIFPGAGGGKWAEIPNEENKSKKQKKGEEN